MPEQTASSGVLPGAEMSTPSSSDQVPGGEATAARLAAVSFSLAIAGLLLAELLGRRMQAWLGR